MPKVLIIGATGTVGSALASSLLRSGNHTVYGLARTPAKANLLASREITPVPGSATESAAYIELIHKQHIDIVIDVSDARQDSYQILSDLKAAGQARQERAKKLGVPFGGPKLGFIYTSGSWVHGTTVLGQDVNDLDEVVEGAGQVASLVKYRIVLEKTILESNEVLDVAIVRPGMVYGGNSWIFNSFFEPMQAAAVATSSGQAEPVVKIPLNPEGRWGMIHAEDAGSGIHAVVDKLPSLGVGHGAAWPVFNLIGSLEGSRALLTAAARAMGLKRDLEFVEVPADDLFAEALATDQAVSAGRARSVLGWVPRKTGMLAQMNIYVMAWKAAKNLG